MWYLLVKVEIKTISESKCPSYLKYHNTKNTTWKIPEKQKFFQMPLMTIK